MKQRVAFIIIMILICSLLFAMVACGDQQETVVSTTDNTVIPTGNDTSSKVDKQQESQAQAHNNEQDQGGENDEAEETGPTVTSVEALLSRYPTESKSFGDILAETVLRKYGFSEPFFCGYTFSAENSDATLSELRVSVAIKADDTERQYNKYKITFDPVKLDDIANGSYTLTKTKSTFMDQQTYNARDKQNDAEFLSSLYSQDDFTYVAYENEVIPDYTIQQIISDYSDVVNANLSTHYDNVLKDAFGKKYSTYKDCVTNYQWDLGEINENNEVQNAKLTFTWEDNNSSTLYVYNANFTNPVDINSLTSSYAMSNVSATYNREYFFSYNNTIQGTRGELIQAILDKSITDGFDYQNADIMFKEDSASTNSMLGTIRRFVVVVKNDQGIKEISCGIQSASTDNALIEKINQGKFNTSSVNKTVYSQNQLNEYTTSEVEMNR